MPWYYAGPEAKPVGPVSAEQLQSLCAAGTITPETFVIEHTGPGAVNLTWKRYREVLPPPPPLPPVPPAPAATAVPVPTAPVQPAHALFPSAAAGHHAPGGPHRPTNVWCAWGFALSLLGFCFSCVCLGIFPALLAVVLCSIGLVQVNRNRAQGGQGLAVAGLIFSGIALLIAIILIAIYSPTILKAHGLTVTEETSNDSE